MTDTTRVRSLLQNSGYKLYYVANELGISTNTLRLKLNNVTEFKLSEVQRLSALLGLTAKERDGCFFGSESGFKINKRTENERRDEDDVGTAAPDQRGAAAIRAAAPANRSGQSRLVRSH